HKKGVLIVASAGNDDTDRKQYPAAFSFTVTVAALAPDNTKASFSNYGSGVDVCAPGVDVVSTFWDGSYVQWSGTSFAAGIISGVAAVVASHAPRLKVDEVARAIIRSGRSVDAENPQYRGKLGPSDGGLVDVTAALAAADARGEGGGGGGAPDNGGGAPDDGDGPDDDDDDDGDGGGRGRGRDGRRPR
ncbi:MAG TPA: S8 family serine peptidase, partial [Armatimonadota bacterium]|nr:S8 family serine peptidase [Armatimonadota bacterium]